MLSNKSYVLSGKEAIAWDNCWRVAFSWLLQSSIIESAKNTNVHHIDLIPKNEICAKQVVKLQSPFFTIFFPKTWSWNAEMLLNAERNVLFPPLLNFLFWNKFEMHEKRMCNIPCCPKSWFWNTSGRLCKKLCFEDANYILPHYSSW